VLEVVVADVEVHVARRHALEVSVAPARKDLEPDVAALREVAAGDVDQRGAAEISDLDFFKLKNTLEVWLSGIVSASGTKIIGSNPGTWNVTHVNQKNSIGIIRLINQRLLGRAWFKSRQDKRL
jgi:hypothetical protein